MEVAKLIVKELAKEKGLILKDLAERLKINRVTLSNMINGNPTLESLQKIAYALDVPVYKLFQEEEYKINESFYYEPEENKYVLILSDENTFLNASFNKEKDFVKLLIKINSKDFQIRASTDENKEYFQELFKNSLNIQEHILKVINNGKVVVRIFSTETIVSLIELGSVVRILEKFRNYYLNYAPVGRVNQKIFHNEYSRN